MRSKFCCSLLAVTLVAVLVVMGCGPAAPGGTEPIVIGYVGNISSPGTKPCMDIQKMAVEEINAAGGILGRPVKYVIEDGKGETALSVAAAQRIVMGDKALVYWTEGRSEIVLANETKSADLYSDYPHIMIGNGNTDSEVTTMVLEDYDRYKFFFRGFNPEPGHYAWATRVFEITQRMIPAAKKWAILYEDLAWTTMYREGSPELGLPTWDAMAKEDFGLDVVYSKAVKARTGMYLPILEGIAEADADVIFFVSSWFTDTEVFCKQWAESSARDIDIYLYGGVAQTHDFWDMTGGKCLGAMTASYETPITEKTMPLVEKARARGIPCQMHVHCAYNDVYFLKAAIEKAGTADDVEALIKAMETVETEGTIGKVKYEEQKIAPYFHSLISVYPDNPKKEQTGYLQIGGCQFQLNGEMVPTWPEKYAQWDRYKTPAQLRQEAGW